MKSLFSGNRHSQGTRQWRRGSGRGSRFGRGHTQVTFESLESRALLAAMSFTIEDNSGLDPTKYALYAMGSNFTTSAATNWYMSYMNRAFTFVKGALPNNQTPSYKVEAGTTINVPNNAELAGMRLYFFVVPVGGVASATVSGDGQYGYTDVPSITFPAPETPGGVRAEGVAVLGTRPDPAISGINTSYVESITITNPGSGYTTPPTPMIDAPGAVNTVTLAEGGSGYNEGTENFAIVGGIANAGGSATIGASGSVTAVTLTNRGAGYTTVLSPQNPSISPGSGFEVEVTLVPAATATSTLFGAEVGAEGPSLPMGTEPINPPNFPFITGIVEFTVTTGANTVDLQTVDGFTLPMTITAGSSNKNVTGKQYGQPVAPHSSAVVTRAKIFDAYSKFMTAKGAAGAPYLDLFYKLPNGLVVDGQKGGILSPDLYLAAATTTGDFENLTSPLDDVFTSQLSKLFSSAISATNPLSVQGVPSGSIASQTYTVTYSSSVQYPTPSSVPSQYSPVKSGLDATIAHPALQFTGSDKNPNGSAKNTFYIFSPIELAALEDDAGNPLTGTITAVGGGSPPTTATLTLDHPLPAYVQNGWFVNGNGLFQAAGQNQNAAITPWYVTSVSQDRKTVSLAYTSVNGPVSSTAKTTTTTSQYQFGKLPYISMMLTPGQMVFGNSGVFADSTLQYVAGSDEAKVLGNLEYQVVAAMNRGVLFATGTQNPKAGGTSEVWGTESGWYPLNTQPQNLFSLFMHVGQVDGTPIFFQPENAVQIQGASGPLMGAAYGFPFDENPAATTAVPNPTQVPSKFDQNIGDGQLPTDIVVTFGAWGTSEGPTVNAPATFTVPENTGADPGSPLVWPASPAPFTDPDSQTLTVTLEVADGVINGTNDPTHTGVAVGGTSTARTFTGTIANLNTYFATRGQITYIPPVSVVGTRTLTTRAADSKNSASVTSTIDIVAAALPQVSLAPTTFTIEQDRPRQVALDFTTASFTDPEDLPADTVYTVEMTGSGTLSATSTAGVTFRSLGGGVYEFAGTLTNLDAYFQTPDRILYIPPLGSRTPTSPSFHGTRHLEVTLIRPTDNAASEPVTLTIVVQPNQPPVIQAPLTFAVTLNVQTPLVWPATMTPFADASAESLTVTLAVPTGVLAAASSGGVIVSGSTDIEKQFVGSVAALNAYFKAGNISYTATGTTSQSRPLTITASDGAAHSEATSKILVRDPNPNGPPTINPTTVLEWATENQWFEITYDQLVAASGASDPAHRTVEFTLAVINSGTLQMQWNGIWIPAPTPRFGQAPPVLVQGGTIRWKPPTNTVSSTGQLAFTVGLFDLSKRSLGTSQVFIKILP
jgi:hypothetical protein